MHGEREVVGCQALPSSAAEMPSNSSLRTLVPLLAPSPRTLQHLTKNTGIISYAMLYNESRNVAANQRRLGSPLDLTHLGLDIGPNQKVGLEHILPEKIRTRKVPTHAIHTHLLRTSVYPRCSI